MSTFGRPRCLEGTQTQSRGEIHDWINSNSTQNIYWLHGVAGSGKSTIATTVADELQETRRLGAFLFFGRAAGKLEDMFNRKKSDPREMIRTMAYQLAMSNPVIAKHVADGAHGNALNSSAQTLFGKLILDPLTAAVEAPNFEGPIVIMLDALDECGTESTRAELLRVLKANLSKLPNEVRILITSRPESDIRDVSLKHDSVRTVQLDHGLEFTSRRNVSAYLSQELTDLFKRIGVRPAHEEQLVDSIKFVCEIASGSFTWASTAYRYIANSKLVEFETLCKLVADIQSQAHSGKSNFGIDDLYSNILKSQIPWDNADIRLRFQRVLYLILEVENTLSTDDIDDLLGLSSQDSSDRIVSSLQSVLAYTPGSRSRIRPLHASFSDFLKSDEQKQQPWHIDITENSEHFTQQCVDSFDTMNRILRFNICDFETSFKSNTDILDLQSRIKEKIPYRLKEACLSWAKQLWILPFSPAVVDKLSRFLRNHMLFWLEVLSLIGEAELASSILVDAIRWTVVRNLLIKIHFMTKLNFI